VQGCAAFDYTLTEDTVDPFIENGLSVDAAFDVLHIATLAQVDRFLDVGCNYGFAVDIASRVFGWQSMGIEPGAAGRRGKAELGASIVDGYLTEQTVLGDPFDLILASEVLEHVSEPVSFLRAILQNLAPEGRAVFTTPAAEAIDPVNEPEAVLVALSPGFHVFLASAEGVATLFRAAGFESFEVERRLDTLWIIAAREPKRTLEFPKAVANPEVLETYLDDRSRTAAPGSALASGMASRHFRSLANRGDFANAVQSRERAIDAIATRHGVDAHDPLKAISTLAAGGSAPWNLASVAYSCAMMELIHEHNPKRALDYFDLTIAATDAWSVHAVVIDADSRDLRANALRHRVRALAALGSPEVSAALESLRLPELENARESVHAFVVSVARGHLELARELQEIVIRSAPQFATTTSPHDLTLGFDGLLSLALLDLQSAEDARALRWTSLALSLLDSIPAEHTWEQMTTPMRVNLENSAAVALSRLEGTESALAAPVEPLSSFIPGTVSVIMPVYNGQAHLQTALRSVIDQDEQPLELIIIDDGSTDSSVDIIRTIEFPFPITIIRQANSGQSAARNAGGRAAQGEFLAFIDQDDQWREDHLSILHPALELDKNLACSPTSIKWIAMDKRSRHTS
jgi:SAM-dependent methyltransferase